MFKGERSESTKFLMAFRIFRVANRTNETLINPVTRIATALTYMDGPLIDPWKEDQMRKLEDRLAAGVADTSEDHWTAFLNDFEVAFGNTNERQDSWSKLTKLEQGDDLDLYITTFRRLAGKAGANLDDLGTTEIFKYGLKPGLARKIMEMHTFNPRVPWTFQQWENAAKDSHMKWLNQKEFNDRSNKVRQGLHRALNIQGQNNRNNNNRGRRTTSQGGDAMDIDALRGPDLSPEEKDKLMKANACFYCTKPGHRARECRKKARDRGNQGNNTNNNQPRTQVKAAAPITSPDDIASLLKDNLDIIDEETKLSIIEKLLPQNFPQALN